MRITTRSSGWMTIHALTSVAAAPPAAEDATGNRNSSARPPPSAAETLRNSRRVRAIVMVILLRHASPRAPGNPRRGHESPSSPARTCRSGTGWSSSRRCPHRSASDVFASNAAAANIMPVWQYPHCGTSCSIHAFWMRCSPFCDRPSIVTIFLPTAADTGSAQERTASPSTSTVQAPQTPMPQPYLAPGRSRWPRRTQSSGISGSTSTVRGRPFTFNLSIGVSSKRMAARGDARHRRPSPIRPSRARPAPGSRCSPWRRRRTACSHRAR